VMAIAMVINIMLVLGKLVVGGVSGLVVVTVVVSESGSLAWEVEGGAPRGGGEGEIVSDVGFGRGCEGGLCGEITSFVEVVWGVVTGSSARGCVGETLMLLEGSRGDSRCNLESGTTVGVEGGTVVCAEVGMPSCEVVAVGEGGSCGEGGGRRKTLGVKLLEGAAETSRGELSPTTSTWGGRTARGTGCGEEVVPLGISVPPVEAVVVEGETSGWEWMGSTEPGGISGWVGVACVALEGPVGTTWGKRSLTAVGVATWGRETSGKGEGEGEGEGEGSITGVIGDALEVVVVVVVVATVGGEWAGENRAR
jgi:hypothetical protein